ncbi:Protein tyrosine phosphatase type IVA 1 [Rhizopus stolonifer]|uniref:protein-tyrosine-phosphatase n=1 Tax=Rhizopus stolonifer TaxID=4846 RepID=A0A367JQG9_RHIST|nr:Protein tyrosine phosphatase type IVA 1 [Rhizopus stolonifer]
MLKPPAYNKVQRVLLHPPTYVTYKDKRFLILDTPSISNMSRYIKEFERWNVTDVVRCCKAAYSQQILNEQGIQVHDWFFSDGEFPSKIIIDEWLKLIDTRFSEEDKKPCIAAHCVAGLGRAPVLVAIALIEEGMDPLESVALIRKHRQGAINNKQLKYIENYKRRRHHIGCCIS